MEMFLSYNSIDRVDRYHKSPNGTTDGMLSSNVERICQHMNLNVGL